MNYEDLMSMRRCYYIKGCHRCHFVLPLIARLNANLPIDKKIELIDVTRFHDFGIMENPKIRFLIRAVRGAPIDYPVIFINGQKAYAPSSEMELEAWLIPKLKDEFIIEVSRPYEYEKACEFRNIGFMGMGRKVVCS